MGNGKQLGHLIYERRQPSEPLSTNALTLVGVAAQAGSMGPCRMPFLALPYSSALPFLRSELPV